MNIDSIYSYAQQRQMHKEALLRELTDSLLTGIKTVGDMGAMGATYLIAATLLTGTGAGWLGAKTFSHGDSDIETVKKSYENERLKSDIGYVRGKLQQELDYNKRQEAPKAARIFN